MKFEELKLGMTIFAYVGYSTYFYFIDKWTPDESDPNVYYFPMIRVDKENNYWYFNKESFITKKEANESSYHLIGSCHPLDLMPIDAMQLTIKILLDGKFVR